MGKTELRLDIISAEKTIFSGVITSVVIPGVSGKFGVFVNHASMISPLTVGSIVYTIDGQDSVVEVQGGIAEIVDNVITICAI